MSGPAYVCPRCDGGFNDPDLHTDLYGNPDYLRCPWCGLKLDGEYDPEGENS